MSSSTDSVTLSNIVTPTNSEIITTINDLLSDDCLRLIFTQFSLIEQLVQLRPICRRWHSVLEQMFHGKRTLRIFDCNTSVERFHYAASVFKPAQKVAKLSNANDIRADVVTVKDDDECSKKACQIIPRLFPNVLNLILHCPHLFRVDEISVLLDRMSCRLKCLVIFFMPKQVTKTLWPQIASMPNLDKLYMTRMYNHPQIPQELFPMPVMGRLKEFALGYYTYDVVPILAQLGSQLETLGLSWVTLNAKKFEELLRQNPKIFTNLKELQFSGMISSTAGVNRLNNFRSIMDLICENFRELTFVNILYADQLPLTTIIPILAKIPQLTKLWFYIGAHQLDPNSSAIERVPQLRTVQTLYLEIYDLTPELFCQWVGRIFPNVSHLTVKCVDWLERSVQIEQTLKTEFKCLCTVVFE